MSFNTRKILTSAEYKENKENKEDKEGSFSSKLFKRNPDVQRFLDQINKDIPRDEVKSSAFDYFIACFQRNDVLLRDFQISYQPLSLFIQNIAIYASQSISDAAFPVVELNFSQLKKESQEAVVSELELELKKKKSEPNA